MTFDYRAARDKNNQYTKEQIKKRNDDESFKRPILDFSNHSKARIWDMKKQKHLIDVIPYIVTSINHPLVRSGYYTPGEHFSYKLDIWVHNGIGPNKDRILCLKKTYGKACAICDERQRLIDEGHAWDSKECKALKHSRRVLYCILDYSEGGDGGESIQIMDTSHFLFEKEILEKAERKGENFSQLFDLENGKTIEFYGVEEETTIDGTTFKYIKPKDFDFKDRDPYEPDVIHEAFPLDAMLIVPTYAEQQELLYGVEEGDKEPVQKESPAQPTSNRRRSKVAEEVAEEVKKEDPPKETHESKQEISTTQETSEPSSEEENQIDQMTGACPFGHIFGSDWDAKDSCLDCERPTFRECGNLRLEMSKESEKETPKTTRTRKKK